MVLKKIVFKFFGNSSHVGVQQPYFRSHDIGFVHDLLIKFVFYPRFIAHQKMPNLLEKIVRRATTYNPHMRFPYFRKPYSLGRGMHLVSDKDTRLFVHV